MNYIGEAYLNKINKNLVLEKAVQKRAKSSEKKEEQLSHFISALERTHTNKHLSYLKKLYFDKYVIKEIPKSYIDFLDRQYFDQCGRHITDRLIKEHEKIIIEDQEKSLSVWLEYFCSEDTFMYPMWTKVWAFQGMLKIGNYNSDTYTKRTNQTVYPFVELDREILSKCMDLVLDYTTGKTIKEDDLKQFIKNGNFAKLYTMLLSKRREQILDTKNTDGVWVKYPQGEDYLPLYNSLQGKNTKWCTAGKGTCETQIAGGDFYVYYTYDENHEPTVPRLAIRMRGSYKIEEIRGIGYQQNVEENFENVLEEKLKEFPDAENYKKQVQDTKALTVLYKKYQQGEYFSLQELNFIYEIYEQIEGFGWEKDPRIEEIIKSRHIETDLQQIFEHIDCKNTKELVLRFPHLRYIHHLEFPEDLECSIYMNDVETIGYLKLPKKVNNLSMNKVKKVKQIVLPEKVKYSFSMNALEDISNVTMPKEIGNLYLDGIKYLKRNQIPEELKGDLSLDSLENLESGALPKKMYGTLNIGRIKSTRGKKIMIEGCRKICIHSLTWSQYYGLQENLIEGCSLSVTHFINDPKIKPNYKKQKMKKYR